jgi:hypothetical protein
MPSVIPVKTGIQFFHRIGRLWIPASAGMTGFLQHHQIWNSTQWE